MATATPQIDIDIQCIQHVEFNIARLAPIIGGVGGLGGWFQGFLVLFLIFFLYSHWYIHTDTVYTRYSHSLHHLLHWPSFL